MAKQWEDRYPGVDIVLIEPEPNDELMFQTSIMNFTKRVDIARHGFQSVTIKLAEDYEKFQTICERHGIEISATRVRKVVKHFADEQEKTRAWRKILEQTTARCCGSRTPRPSATPPSLRFSEGEMPRIGLPDRSRAARPAAPALAADPPLADTGAAKDVGQTQATLTAKVTPRGAATSVRFDLGTSTSYGLQSSSKDIGPAPTRSPSRSRSRASRPAPPTTSALWPRARAAPFRAPTRR